MTTPACDWCKLKKKIASLTNLLRPAEWSPISLCCCFWDFVYIEELLFGDSTLKCFDCHKLFGILRDRCRKIYALKIKYKSGPSFALAGISAFVGVRSLELSKFPVYLLGNLGRSWPCLKFLACRRSGISRLRDLLRNSSDKVHPWGELQYIDVSYNDLADLDDSVSLFSNLKLLNLSYNKLKVVEGIELLREVECLNLGYNHLEIVPQFSGPTCNSLRSLILSGNAIDDLTGLQYLAQLEHLDLRWNLLCSHTALLTLKELTCLSQLKLEGNPLTYHKQHRPLTCRCLSTPSQDKRFILDGVPLTDREIKMSESSLSQGLLQDSSISTASSRSIGYLGVPKAGKKKPNRMREVKIIDRDQESMDGSESAAFSIVNPEDDSKHLLTKKLLEEKREKLGSSWLVSTSNTPVNTLPQQQHFLDSKPLEPEFISDSNVREEDDVEVLPEERDTSDPNEDDRLSAPLSPAGVYEIHVTSPNSATEMSQHGDEGDDELFGGELFLVNRVEDGTDLFVSVGQDKLVERDAISGKVQNTLDLRALINACQPSENAAKGEPNIQLAFDTRRKENRERMYRMESLEALQSFLDLMQQIIQGRPPTFVLQCQKCSAEFPEELVASIVVGSFGTKNNSGGDSLPKDPKVVSACPKCNSTILLQLQPNETSTPASRNGREAADNTQINGLSDLESRNWDSILPSANSAGNGQLGQEDDSAERRNNAERSESDITILSNPSQSSIAVVSDYGMQEEHDYSRKMMSVLLPCYERDDDASSTRSSEQTQSGVFSVGMETSTFLMGRFLHLDHQIKLYLEMEVFTHNEEVAAVLEGGLVILGSDGTECSGLFIATERHFYAFSIRPNSQEISESLRLECSCPIKGLRSIATLPNHRGFCVRFEDQGFVILLRDATLCEEFLAHLAGSMPHKQELFDTKLIPEKLCRDCQATDDPSFFLFRRSCHAGGRAGENLYPEALAVTSDNLYALKIEYLQANQPLRFTTVEIQHISNLTSLHTGSNTRRLGMHFLDEVMNRETFWSLDIEDSVARDLLAALEEPWESTFGIELRPRVIDLCTCMGFG